MFTNRVVSISGFDSVFTGSIFWRTGVHGLPTPYDLILNSYIFLIKLRKSFSA